VGELIRQRGWVEWVGDLGRQATGHLIGRATGGDVVWQAGVEEQVRAMSAELLGPNPGVLEELLVRRAVNGWVAVHALELEAAVRPPADRRNKAFLDAAIGRAQRRMTQALVELARVRRLQAPRVVARLTVLSPGQDLPNTPALPPHADR